jgi:hypothetical protein
MIPSGRVDPFILGHLLGQHRDLHARLLALRADFAVGHEAQAMPSVATGAFSAPGSSSATMRQTSAATP